MGLVATAAAQDATTTLPRVRSSSVVVIAAMDLGRERSPIFRSLLSTIDATDGLVYIDEGACGQSVRACLLPLVTVAGVHRVLRILVDPRKTAGCSLVGSIGHELHHAIEALSDRRVTNGDALVSLFQRIGPTGSGRFETTAAIRMGLSVEREACSQKR